MTSLSKSLFRVAMGAGMLALSTMNAAAAIACNRHECWHVTEVYTYPLEAGIIVHPDGWVWAPHEHFVWREHVGRGYWIGGRWRGW